MKRIRELIADTRERYPIDDFFADFDHTYRIDPLKRKYYRSYNDALMALDIESWSILKGKALDQYLNHRNGQRKEGFFNQLNEAFAYRYLVRKGFKSVRFIEEGNKKSPDISFDDRNVQSYCEVKTLGISDDEIGRRYKQLDYDGSVYVDLSEQFLKKLKGAIGKAWKQIHSFGENGLVFVFIRFDDPTLDHYHHYRKQLIKFCRDLGFDNLLMKIGARGNKRICITSGHK